MLTPTAEWLDVVGIPHIVNMGDERDMGIGPRCHLQLSGDVILEVDKGIHIGTGCSQHIITPEDDLHLEFVIPDNTLY